MIRQENNRLLPDIPTIIRRLSVFRYYARCGNLCVNLKYDPFDDEFLRQIYKDVTPGYHMNKIHWYTVAIGGDVPDDELKLMIECSYNLIKPKVRKKRDA